MMNYLIDKCIRKKFPLSIYEKIAQNLIAEVKEKSDFQYGEKNLLELATDLNETDQSYKDKYINIKYLKEINWEHFKKDTYFFIKKLEYFEIQINQLKKYFTIGNLDVFNQALLFLKRDKADITHYEKRLRLKIEMFQTGKGIRVFTNTSNEKEISFNPEFKGVEEIEEIYTDFLKTHILNFGVDKVFKKKFKKDFDENFHEDLNNLKTAFEAYKKKSASFKEKLDIKSEANEDFFIRKEIELNIIENGIEAFIRIANEMREESCYGVTLPNRIAPIFFGLPIIGYPIFLILLPPIYGILLAICFELFALFNMTILHNLAMRRHLNNKFEFFDSAKTFLLTDENKHSKYKMPSPENDAKKAAENPKEAKVLERLPTVKNPHRLFIYKGDGGGDHVPFNTGLNYADLVMIGAI